MDILQVSGDDYYLTDDSKIIIAREYGLSPNGNPYRGSWVMRDYRTGNYIDHDYNRNNLFERNQAKVLEL